MFIICYSLLLLSSALNNIDKDICFCNFLFSSITMLGPAIDFFINEIPVQCYLQHLKAEHRHKIEFGDIELQKWLKLLNKMVGMLQ